MSDTTPEYPTFVTHLECSMTGERHEADQPHGLSRAGKPLLVRYDLAAIGKAVSKQALSNRPAGMWRYREMLPVRRSQDIVTLGETMTPLIACQRLGDRLGAGPLFIKDEGGLPTGSFKARGLCMAVSMAQALGIRLLAMPTAGNAGAALAAYAARAGLPSYVFCPQDTPATTVRQIAAAGAAVWLIDGLINDCGKIVADGKEEMGWFDLSTLKEPYRIEGKKTMGLELAEQFEWDAPDVILYPTGGGTGLIAIWKAFEELGQLGWVGPRRPRMVAVQASGCAPIVEAYERGAPSAQPWPDAQTLAPGLRVPAAIGDFLMLRTIRESDGFATAVDDREMLAARDEVAKTEGVLMCPEGAATFAAYKKELNRGRIAKDESVVLFNTATGLKHPLPEVDRHLNRNQPIDYHALRG